MLLSLARLLLIAVILAVSLGIALFVGLALADLGALGTCEDGTCQLVAGIYVMPIGGIVLYVLALIVLSIRAGRHGRTEDRE